MTTLLKKLAAVGFGLVLGGQVLLASAGGEEGPYPTPGVPENTIVQGAGGDNPFPPEQPTE
jgi:hypothetical protein